MPLPPYITERTAGKERYQTVYAKENGSAAAPTAGLHFTTELLDDIRKKGVTIVDVLLHVGLGTFRPVSEDNVEDHHMNAAKKRQRPSTRRGPGAAEYSPWAPHPAARLKALRTTRE